MAGKEFTAKMHMFLVLLSVVLVLTAFVVKKGLLTDAVSQKQGFLTDPSPVTLTEKYENGVYTNYTYRYRYEYPADKFIQGDYQIEGSTPENPITIKLGNYWFQSNFRKQFEDLYKSKPGATLMIGKEKHTKLASRDFGNYRLVTSFSTVPFDTPIEHSVSYSAAWLTEDDVTIVMSMFTYPEYEKFLVENRSIFDQIVESFELIER